MIKELPGRTKPYIMAHRGNTVRCPENTLASFRQAFDDGADVVETDLRQSADGSLVCMHDATVDRTTDGSGIVEEMRLTALKQLNAGPGTSTESPERIPTLRELAAITPHDRAIAVELKSDAFLESHVIEHLVSELDQERIRERTIVISFSLLRLAALRRHAPDIPIGRITVYNPWPQPGAELLGPLWPVLVGNPLFVRFAHRRGQLVCPLDPKPDKRLRLYRLLQCDALLTNDPLATLRAVRRIGWRDA